MPIIINVTSALIFSPEVILIKYFTLKSPRMKPSDYLILYADHVVIELVSHLRSVPVHLLVECQLQLFDLVQQRRLHLVTHLALFYGTQLQCDRDNIILFCQSSTASGLLMKPSRYSCDVLVTYCDQAKCRAVIL